MPQTSDAIHYQGREIRRRKTSKQIVKFLCPYNFFTSRLSTQKNGDVLFLSYMVRLIYLTGIKEKLRGKNVT